MPELAKRVMTADDTAGMYENAESCQLFSPRRCPKSLALKIIHRGQENVGVRITQVQTKAEIWSCVHGRMRRDTVCLGAIALATCLVSYNSLQYLSRSLTPSEGAYLDGTADEQVVRQPILLSSKGDKRGSGRSISPSSSAADCLELLRNSSVKGMLVCRE